MGSERRTARFPPRLGGGFGGSGNMQYLHIAPLPAVTSRALASFVCRPDLTRNGYPSACAPGTIDSERLVYRSTDRVGMSSPFSVAPIAAVSLGRVGPVAIWGDEPQIPD